MSISRAIRNQNECTPSVDRPCLEQKIANRPHAYIEIYNPAVDPSTSKIRYTSKRALKGKPIGQWGPGIRQPAAPARLLERKPCMGPEKQKVRSTIMCPPRNRPSCATQRFGFVGNPLFFKKIDLGRVPAQDGRSHPYLFSVFRDPRYHLAHTTALCIQGQGAKSSGFWGLRSLGWRTGTWSSSGHNTIQVGGPSR